MQSLDKHLCSSSSPSGMWMEFNGVRFSQHCGMSALMCAFTHCEPRLHDGATRCVHYSLGSQEGFWMKGVIQHRSRLATTFRRGCRELVFSVEKVTIAFNLKK